MRRIKVLNHITLDGVLQPPGKPEEDPRAPSHMVITTTGVVIVTYEQL
jgi:hypothetical protein